MTTAQKTQERSLQMRKMAELARLELSDAELHAFASQVGETLAYVEQISAVNTESVDPLVNPHDQIADVSHRLRDDEIRPPLVDETGKPKMLGPAPEIVRDGFKVPPVL